MRLAVDRAECLSYGNCVDHEPRVFDLDEGGRVKLLVEGDIAPELSDGVRAAVRDCPVRVLAIVE